MIVETLPPKGRAGRRWRSGLATAALGFALTGPAWAQAPAAPATPPATVKIGIVSFLTGPGAGPFGIPGRNAAELIVDAINSGTMPPPYNTAGLGGAKIETKIIDESGSAANQVTEFRNLVQRDGMEAVVGYVSSGNCLAVAPVVEELKVLTVFYDCGTPRIFEESPKKYIFRVSPTATMDSVGAARYVTAKIKDLPSYSGVNQNYAWGQDSWRDFVLAMKALSPAAKVEKDLFPKLFAGEYGAEISALLTTSSKFVHTSFWNGDLESFIFQSSARGLSQKMPLVATTAETAMFRIKDKMPDGTIVGARGPHGVFAPDTELNRWFRKTYEDRFSMPPTYPSYHMAQSLLGLKAAWDKAAAKAGKKPTTDEVVAAFEGIEFEAPSAKIRMAIGKGHQGISDIAYGTYKYNKAEGRPEIIDIVRYNAECVNPPEGTTSQKWLEDGMPGAKCN